MVPSKVCVLEENHREEDEDYERDNLLHDFQLDEREGASVAVKSDAVGGNLQAIFNEGDAPGEDYDGNQRPVRTDAGRLEFQVAIPGEGHEYVGGNQEEYGQYGGFHNGQ